jgi:nitrite reductase/ring-hydroxylating ferredoxin subunit
VVSVTDSAQLLCGSDDIDELGTGFRFGLKVGDRIVPAFAIRYQGKVYAYLNQCAHLAVELDWQPGVFFDSDKKYLMCATHGALYYPDSGACAYGRCAGRGLIPVEAMERDGKIMIISESTIHFDENKQQKPTP